MDPASPDDPPEPQREDRRQHPRTKIAVEAELQSERTTTPLRVKTADLSLDGFLVMTRDFQVGNGIEFTDIASEDRLRLKRFLAAADDAQSPK